MKNLNLTAAAVSLTLLASPLAAQELKSKPAGDASAIMSMDKPTFFSMATSANEFEIRSSELAKPNGENADLKAAADMIIADHTKAGEKLKSTVDAKDSPPADPAQLAPKHQKMLQQLEATKGKDFDTLYLDMQSQAHMEAIALFRTYAGSGEDQALVGFAKETLPSLETHLNHIKMLIEDMS